MHRIRLRIQLLVDEARAFIDNITDTENAVIEHTS